MTIAQELEDRMWYLADPAVQWVRGTPAREERGTPAREESCLVLAGRRALSWSARRWLNGFFSADNSTAAGFNDNIARDRNDVLWMLQEAVDQARWEGV